MSWHYLQEEEEASWEGSSLDGAPSALLKLTHTTEAFCCDVKKIEPSHDFQFGTTCKHLMESCGTEKLTSSQEVSLARTSARQETESGSPENAVDYGVTWQESFARFDQNTCSWKTRQRSLLEDWESFSGIFPRWGMMQGGECWALDTLEPAISGTEFGFWPTPQVSGRIQGKMRDVSIHKSNVIGGHQLHLTGLLSLIGISKERYPAISEWVMGWPDGWSDLKPLETDKFRRWLNLHGSC